jgi:hypothetical protein
MISSHVTPPDIYFKSGRTTGAIDLRLYCFGFTRFKFQMGTGDVLVEARRKNEKMWFQVNVGVRSSP